MKTFISQSVVAQAIRLVLGIALLYLPILANAQYRIVVPFAPGGGTDVVARTLASHLTNALGQQFIVENRSGANGMVGLQAVANASDSRTVGMLSSQMVLVAIAREPNLLNSIQGVGLLGINGYVVAVPASSNIRSIEDLRAGARSRISWGTSGAGTTGDLCAHQLTKSLGGGDVNTVHYKGDAPMLVDLMVGNVAVGCAGASAAKAHVESGKLRALGTTLPFPSSMLPSVPPLSKSGITDVMPGSWMMLVATRSTPVSATGSMTAGVRRALVDSSFVARWSSIGFEGIPADDVKPEIAESFLRRQITELTPYARLVQ